MEKEREKLEKVKILQEKLEKKRRDFSKEVRTVKTPPRAESRGKERPQKM